MNCCVILCWILMPLFSHAAGVGACPLSGFTRRLFLQVLLEDETVVMALRSTYSSNPRHMHSATEGLQHPRYEAGRRLKTLKVNVHSTIGEMLSKISGCVFCVCYSSNDLYCFVSVVILCYVMTFKLIEG